MDPKLNTLSKLNCILASIEANKLGFDEGIMCDINEIYPHAIQQIFFVKNNEIITSTGKYCLNGITRNKVIEVCKDNSIHCSETDFVFEDISECQEAFVTGTFGGVTPVKSLEGRILQSCNLDSLTMKIDKLLEKK